MADYSTTPETAGPARDGSKSLARESKYGQAVTALLSILALGLAGWLGDLDVSTLPGWLIGAATVAASTFAGILTAWATRNRPRALQLYSKD